MIAEKTKPVVKGSVSGNIYVIVGAASRALVRAGQAEVVKEMRNRVHRSTNYDEALRIVMEYVEFDL